MSRLAIALLAVATLIACTQAASIKWTGYAGNNQWTTNNNWYPNNVPGPNDDVTIDSGVVLVTVPTGVNSLVMGTQVSSLANLTLFQPFYVGSGGMTVEANGNLFINSGSANISGTIQIGGNLYFSSGQLSGQWTIGSRAMAFLTGMGQKSFSGCQFNANGQTTLQGIISLSQQSVFQVGGQATASGNFAIQAADNSGVLFTSTAGTLTYVGGGDFSIQAPVAFGTFNFQAGNLSFYDNVTLASLAIPSGSYVASFGNAAVAFTGMVSGAGVFSVASTSVNFTQLNLSGALNLLSGSGFFGATGSVNILTISGGNAFVSGSLTTTQLNLLVGSLQGTIAATNVYTNTQGFNLNGALSISKAASISPGSLFAFGSAGQITIHSTAIFGLQGSLQFTGAPGSLGVTNNGAIVANHHLAFTNINLGGTGNLTAAATVSLNTISFAQTNVFLTGNGIFKGASTTLNIGRIYGSPVVQGQIGSYSFQCPYFCSTVTTSQVPTSTFKFVVAQ
jgi:hypothetical protein